ncbi:MAG: alpha/beta hydrolase, partial [Candidatus Bathyarchaeum sp.]
MEVISWILLTVGVVVATVFVIIVLKFRNIMSKNLRRLASIQSQIYTSKHADVEYLLRDDGPTVLVSHGITGGVDQGIGLSKDYIGDGYQLLFVSRFGYLKSSLPANPSPELQAEVYKELLDYLNIEKTFVFGNSAGGTSALHFAIKYPETCAGLILV